MFTCPDKEIHSVYLDGELPASIERDYEAHIASCDKCRAELKRLQFVRDILEKDALSITPDNAFKERSWLKLSNRLRYNRIIKDARPSWAVQKSLGNAFAKGVWHILPAAVAAAIVAVVLPVRMRQSAAQGGAEQAAQSTVNAPMLTSVPMTGGMIGTMPNAIGGYTGGAVNASLPQFGNVPFNGGKTSSSMGSNTAGFYHKRRGGVPRVFGNTTGGSTGLALDVGSIDMFRPDFSEDEEKTISIRISVPGLKGERAYTTISVPVDALKTAEE